MKNKISALKLFVCTIISFGAAAATQAQAPQQQAPQQQASQPQIQVGEAQLSQATKVYQSIQTLQQKLQTDLAGEENQEVIQKKVEEAREKIPGILQSNGLTEAEYEQVLQAVNQDPELREKFITKVGGNQSRQAQPQEQSSAPAEITDGQLQKAAVAYRAIGELNQQLRNDMDGVEDQDQIRAMVQEAQKVQSGIIQEAGLTEQEYSQMMQVIGNDQDLMEKFLQTANP
jgi:hypothetical protein